MTVAALWKCQRSSVLLILSWRFSFSFKGKMPCPPGWSLDVTSWNVSHFYLLLKQHLWLWTRLQCLLFICLGAVDSQSSYLCIYFLSWQYWFVIVFNHIISTHTCGKYFSQGNWTERQDREVVPVASLVLAGVCLPAHREEDVFVGSSYRWHFLHMSDLFIFKSCTNIYLKIQL